MMITERQSLILERIIKDYIELAQPVSSEFLEKKYDFGICPATIRIEMQKLTDKGFLFQPYTSAGRVPTDRGYRFFVNSLLEKDYNPPKDGASRSAGTPRVPTASEVPAVGRRVAGGLESHSLLRSERAPIEDFKVGDWLEKEIEDTIKFIQSLTKNLAQSSGALAISYLEKERIFLKEGWEEILREPEFEEKDFLLNFVEFLENFEKNIEDFNINSGIKIYIGKENPFKKAKEFSIIFSKCHLPNEDYNPPTASSHSDKSEWAPVIISLLGPKRMAYDRNISLINSLTKLLEEF